MILCRADITSKNDHKVKKYIANFDLVEEKMKEVEERDRIRNFQPPITGMEILDSLNIEPSKIIGDIKTEIKEAILEGKIANDAVEAKKLMLKIAQREGLSRRN